MTSAGGASSTRASRLSLETVSSDPTERIYTDRYGNQRTTLATTRRIPSVKGYVASRPGADQVPEESVLD
jgi:hypothetical protein